MGDRQPVVARPARELIGEIAPHGVIKSVYIQINVAPGNEIAEAEWVQSVADTHGFPHGIVAYADLGAADVAGTLDRLLDCANLRGIRQQLHWHEKPLYRFASRPDLMNDAAWRAGLRELEAQNTKAFRDITESEERIGFARTELVNVTQRLADSFMKKAKTDVPKGLRWDLFLGAAPDVEYHPLYHPFNWRGWVDWGQGALGDMGCHMFFPVYYAIELGAPLSVDATSSGFNSETYPLKSVIKYDFAARGN